MWTVMAVPVAELLPVTVAMAFMVRGIGFVAVDAAMDIMAARRVVIATR
jgi:hypothetical protein